MKVEYRPIPRVVLSYPKQTFSTYVASLAVPKIVKHCREKGVPVDAYTGILNRRRLVLSAIRTAPAGSLVVYIGHGLGGRWIGNEFPYFAGLSRGILTLNDTHTLAGRHVIAIACDTFRELGIRALADGALSYIAWDDKVLVDTLDSNRDNLPDVADTFATLVNAMVDYGDPQYAVTTFKYKCEEYINKYLAEGNIAMAEKMRRNLEGITVY